MQQQFFGAKSCEASEFIRKYMIVRNGNAYWIVSDPCSSNVVEKHDSNTITHWLNEWERHGAPCPNEVIIDNSPALKSALARSFGRSVDLHHYIETTFNFLLHKQNHLPPCFIRIDVAHFINKASKWKL